MSKAVRERMALVSSHNTVTQRMLCYAFAGMGRGAEIPTGEAAEAGRQRRRAPRRTGRRTQLTVPDGMWLELTEIATAAGTTPNDVLVLLAGERLDDRRRAASLKRLADDRWRAFTDADGGAPVAEGVKPLTEEQLVELSRAFREDA